jgi:hypothetical protein
MVIIHQPKKAGQIACSDGTKFYTEQGHEIKGVSKATIIYKPGDIVEVELRVALAEVTYGEEE